MAFQKEQRQLLGGVQRRECLLPARPHVRAGGFDLARADAKNNNATPPAAARFSPNQASHCRRVPLRKSSTSIARLTTGTINIAG